MDKKKEILDFDYPQLDLSDDQSKISQKNNKQLTGQPSKKIKTDSLENNNQKNINQSSKISNNLPNKYNNPPFFPPPPPKGNTNISGQNWIPPPPITSRPPNFTNQNNNQARQQYNNKGNYNNNRDNRQKNNFVYVKNIPKNFNTQQKLMTFFKNQGIIKQIKINETEQSAVIKFLKEQHALKFLKSNKFIFNRSFIVYGNKDNLTVSQQQIQDRITDQQGIIKKAQQTNQKVLKQKLISHIAQHIRSLYFFENQIIQNQDQETKTLKELIINDLEFRKNLKNNLENQTNDSKIPDQLFLNEYNYLVTIKRQSTQIVEKKGLFAQFLKYGPIVSLEYQSQILKKENQKQQPSENKQQAQEKLYNYEINVLFLSLKSLWAFYFFKNQQFQIQIQGSKVQKIFNSGKLKPIQNPIKNEISLKKPLIQKKQENEVESDSKKYQQEALKKQQENGQLNEVNRKLEEEIKQQKEPMLISEKQ